MKRSLAQAMTADAMKATAASQAEIKAQLDRIEAKVEAIWGLLALQQPSDVAKIKSPETKKAGA